MNTWDEKKRIENMAKHNGIDFANLECLFDAPMVTVEDSRKVYGEKRLQSLCWYHGRVVFLVWTERGDDAHLISCRYGDKHETRQYFKALGF